MAAPVCVYVSEGGNAFMRDIATWFAEAASCTGRDVRIRTDGLPEPDGTINLVIAPHEFFELHPDPDGALRRAAAASICIATEQPGTPWFDLSLDACRHGLVALDINRHGVDAMRDHGVDARFVQLGAVPSMTAPLTARVDRPVDVLFLGSYDDRRGELLADLAPSLVDRRCDLRLFDFSEPVAEDRPGLLFGDAKYGLLRTAKVLVNLHRGRADGSVAPYFEWARMVEAMANGCVVLSEPSSGHEPLVPGEHLVEAAPAELAARLGELLADDAERDRLARAAHRAVTDDLALTDSFPTVLEELEEAVLPRVADHVAGGAWRHERWRLGRSRRRPVRHLGPFRPYASIRRRAKSLALAENEALRTLDRGACLLRHGSEQHTVERASRAYAASVDVERRPEVSVVVTVYDYAHLVGETIGSIAASRDVAFEIVVVEDHATDDSRAVLAELVERFADVPMLVIGKDANEGLSAARNDGVARARADLVMVMDADNLVYPTCLRRLADTLGDHPGAAAAYSILECFGARRGLTSAFDWDPRRLTRSNFIDAQALWRRDHLVDLGGFVAPDEHVYGWEDWDLWLRLAERGGRAVLRREILGRYRTQVQSMISLTNLETDAALASMRMRHPTLPWPHDAPGETER